MEIIIAGFGGQGVIFAGNVLANSAMQSNKNVTFFKSYGTEVRGGTANSTVIIADEEIACPISYNPDYAIIMNTASLDKFEPKIKKNGTIIVNKSLINREVKRKDIKVINIPATELAEKLGNKVVANMVALGKFIKVTKAVSFDIALITLNKILENKPNIKKINQEALKTGGKYEV